MFGCKRSNTDPLLQIMLTKYRLHLLQWPREGISPGDLVIEKPDGQTLRMPLSVVFASAPEEMVRSRSSMADIEETFSSELNAKGGVQLLEQIAAAFGGSGGSFKTAYEKAAKVIVRLRMSKWLDCDPSRLSTFLTQAELRHDQGMFAETDALYVINGVALAKSIEIIAFDSRGAEIAVAADVVNAGSASVGLKARGDGGASIIYEGAHPLVFGVELLKLEPNGGNWAIKGVDRYVQLRGDDGEGFPKSASAFIGDPTHGPISIDLIDPES
jgi:hypothetical protein